MVQSMTKTDTRDVASTVAQIRLLKEAGCEIVRVAVPDREAAKKLGEIRKRIELPLVADIHFDYRLALEALDQGVDGLRLNPGNIGRRDRVAKVAKMARERRVPIRIGVNAGSLEKNLLQKYGGPSPDALVESALAHVRLLEDLDFDLIKISLKASDPLSTVSAYKKISQLTDYPLHIGVTEAGPPFSGGIKSAVGSGNSPLPRDWGHSSGIPDCRSRTGSEGGLPHLEILGPAESGGRDHLVPPLWTLPNEPFSGRSAGRGGFSRMV